MSDSSSAGDRGTTSVDDLIAAGDIQGVMRLCHARRLEREGIPMVLGLADERQAIPRNADAAQLASGAAFRDLLADYYAELVPFSRPDDEGALITAMQVVAFTHLEPDAAESRAIGARDAAASVPLAVSPPQTGPITAPAPLDEDDGMAEGVRV